MRQIGLHSLRPDVHYKSYMSDSDFNAKQLLCLVTVVLGNCYRVQKIMGIKALHMCMLLVCA